MLFLIGPVVAKFARERSFISAFVLDVSGEKELVFVFLPAGAADETGFNRTLEVE